jgi:hypothetical protein
VKKCPIAPWSTGHSHGAAMGKKKKSKPIGENFVPVVKFMINSPAFKRLTNASRVAYLLLKAQCNKPGQRDVIFPYSHAAEYMNRHTFSRSINQLVEFGFIEKSDFGGLFRRTNVYRLIEEWRKIK